VWDLCIVEGIGIGLIEIALGLGTAYAVGNFYKNTPPPEALANAGEKLINATERWARREANRAEKIIKNSRIEDPQMGDDQPPSPPQSCSKSKTCIFAWITSLTTLTKIGYDVLTNGGNGEPESNSNIPTLTTTPSLTPTMTPSLTPTMTPSLTPTTTPTLTPTMTPTLTPTLNPTHWERRLFNRGLIE